MSDHEAELVYHWSPASRAKSIRRVGLKPGSLSRHKRWRPPFISFSRNPEYALGSAHEYDPIHEDMDLWQLDMSDLSREELSIKGHDEIRIYERIPYRDLTYLATRKFQTEDA